MPAKASEEEKVRVVRQRQKNGDIYLIERHTRYDPEKKYNVVLSSRVISKIPKGEELPVPTRPKRKKGEKVLISEERSPVVSASRTRVGMMDIIDHIGEISGIDDAVYGNTDRGTAQKILSLARYLLATNGQSLPGISTWQFTHPLPYEDGISEDVYHDLFEAVGLDEQLQQNFFASRIAGIRDRAVLAYASTTISTYSTGIPEARRGFNKAHDGLDTVKLLTLYSIETRQPVAFTKASGNLPDVIMIENALKQMSVLGIGAAEIITDNGYYSEKNLAEMLHAHFDFITLIKCNISWVKKELKAHRDEFRSTSSACPFDTNTHGITVMRMHEFARNRIYANKKSGIPAGSEETFTRRIYLHLFFNPIRRVEEDSAFDKDLFEIKKYIEEGGRIEELSENAQNKVSQYMNVRHYGSKVTVVFREKEIQELKDSHGYFALVSNSEKDPFECLRKYRRRETIESFFEAGKQKADGARTRVWDTNRLRGRMFVQFVALCYYEHYSEMLRQMKQSLARENGTPEHDLKENLKLEAKLKTWLSNTPVYLTLQWFDTIEEVRVSTKILSKRWSSEMTQRDRMFLEKLGMQSS